ncbi:transglycosylase domain-containing protein [Propionimicrobium sp. PCR01-08-3]|uniref:transglycosylase domain-containing protein n=1 Tax=Propionimicrobium sp. PCR01-08-3 TaxID=3052086 RepID=UPI00255CDBA0|nr:transglycosylase domain-containing protein [Propionimicrobium sp. PCR01-08-3]WIY82498.1 transglycosylase domain-containing protein [Propionimicrobium sp. PCR01-08-3]
MADKAKSPKRGSDRPKSGKGASRVKKSGRAGHIAKIAGIVVLSVLLVVSIVGIIIYEKAELPDPNADFGTQTSKIYFNDGTSEMGSLAIQNRTNIDYGEMPQSIKDAAVAAEDRTFWTNQGVDFKGLARAVWGLVTNQEITGGGSTITQQYIKIRYLTSEQTFSRKFNELALAMKMNKAESKEEVLEGYLNTIYFGRGAYGIQAAAQAYFQVDAGDLTVGQSAALAAMVNTPSALDPANGDEAAQQLLDRYNYVLDGMLDPMGSITQEEHDQFYGQLPEFPDIATSDVYGGPNGFLIDMAVNELESKGFTPEQINGGGLSIVTTVDARMQQAAIDAVDSTVQTAVENARGSVDENGNWVEPDPNGLHTGLASLDVSTGGIVALYGGADYVSDSRNWATTPRYAASTFKVWGAVAGLRNGFGLSSTLQGSTYTPPGDSVPVHNDSGAQYGTITLQTAIRDSVNTAFVDLVGKIPNGTEELVRAATDAGLVEHDSWAPQLNRMVLGEGEVSALENATGYATLANNGVRNETHIVAQVTDASGNVVYSGNTEGTQAIEDAVARDLTYGLAGSAEAAQRTAVGGRDVAGKTGTEGVAAGQDGATAQITRSAWLAGYTKQIATAVVMVAGDDGNGNLDVYNPAWRSAFYGAGYPTDVWAAYMSVATEGMDAVPFDPPANIQPTVQNSLPVNTPSAPATTAAPTETATTEAPASEEPPETPGSDTGDGTGDEGGGDSPAPPTGTPAVAPATPGG